MWTPPSSWRTPLLEPSENSFQLVTPMKPNPASTNQKAQKTFQKQAGV
jgi:hypothetical protein